MKKTANEAFSVYLLGQLVCAVLLISILITPSASAGLDNIFFTVNGNPNQTSMTQGDEFFWGSDCDFGATINWEVWYDANGNSAIDRSSDFLLTSENITDGDALTEADPILDGFSIGEVLILTGQPGDYIFRATDIAFDSSIQAIMTMIAMSSPPNQLLGEISIPGISPPNSLLENRFIFAESALPELGFFIAMTNNMGQYTMNLGAAATGVEIFMMPSNISGYVTPDGISAIASGVVAGNDFLYIAAVDSVWGFVKDETETLLSFETDVSADSDEYDREVTTSNSRYAIYFSDADKGNWSIESSSRNSPIYLTPGRFEFSHDTLNSFQYDITLTKADTTIHARITENGGLPANNYRIDAYSNTLDIWAEAISNTGADNIAALHVLSADLSNWEVFINQWDDDVPIPFGLVAQGGGRVFNVSPGDTVDLELVDGLLVSGTLTQDPEDDPIFWDDIYVSVGLYGANPDGSGVYSIYTEAGFNNIGVYSDSYISDPQSRFVEVTEDITSGVDFIVNNAHCQVSGTLTNVTLPLNDPYYTVVAFTGTSYLDGYYVLGQVDQMTGTYSMNLCDGDWTIMPPCCLPDASPPANAVLTIGESPDNSRTVDFAYSGINCCTSWGLPGDANADGDVNLLDILFIISYKYEEPFDAPTNSIGCDGLIDADGNGNINLLDILRLIGFLYDDPPGPDPACP